MGAANPEPERGQPRGAAQRSLGFDAFRDSVQRTFGSADLRQVRPEDPFAAALEASSIDDVAMVALQADAVTLTRSRRDISRCDGGGFTLSLTLDGDGVLIQSGREARVSSGDLVLCDARRPFEMCFDGAFEQLLFNVDAERVLERLPSAGDLTAIRLDGGTGIGAIVQVTLRAMHSQAPSSLASVAAPLTEQVLDLAALAFTGVANEAHRERMTLGRVKRWIELNLASPSLSPRLIAEGVGLSRRKLYRLFEGEAESVRAYILRRRLERCRDEIERASRSGRTITEIAFRWGFNSASHFSRAFYRAFGVVPSAARRSAGPGE